MTAGGDTNNIATRGSTFAAFYRANPNMSVAEACKNTMNSLPPAPAGGSACGANSGGHGFNGCGCNVALGFDANLARAQAALRESWGQHHPRQQRRPRQSVPLDRMAMQLPVACRRPDSLGETVMRKFARSFSVSALLAAGFASSALPESAGLLSADPGGATGYLHSVERSRFVAGRSADELHAIKEFGFSKIVGTTGVAATNLRNGLFIATQNGGADKDAASPPGQETEKPGYPLDPDRHNGMVMEYFISAGVPREQVGGVHANTYLSAAASSGAGAPGRRLRVGARAGGRRPYSGRRIDRVGASRPRREVDQRVGLLAGDSGEGARGCAAARRTDDRSPKGSVSGPPAPPALRKGPSSSIIPPPPTKDRSRRSRPTMSWTIPAPCKRTPKS